ncbi:MAG: hypothetical protein ACRDKX_06310 [Solirubrobacterales bacterium]
MNRHAVSTVTVLAATMAFLVLPGVVFAKDKGDVTTEAATAEVPTSTEDPPADIPPPEETTEPPAPVETTEPAEPADSGDEPEPAPPAPADPADAGGGSSPSGGYSEPAPDPPDRVVPESSSTVEPTGYESPSGGSEVNRVDSDADSAHSGRAKGETVGCRAANRVDVGEVGDNQAVHGSLGGCVASEVGIESLNQPVTVGDVTFTFDVDNTPDGPVLSFTTNVPFTGSLFVKGGPNHFQCDFEAVMLGTCHAPVNDNNDRFFGFSHVDVCVSTPETPPIVPPTVTETPPGGNQPAGGGGGGGQQQDQQEVAQEQEEEEVAPPGVTPAGVPVATAAPPGEELPFTGLDPAWLVLLGAGLLCGGALVRRQVS